MRHKLKRSPAESMVESIISITVIVITTTAALSLLRVAILGNNVVGEKLVAVNLAMEAVEALRNQRDTNYLRFPGFEEDCWDAYDVDSGTECQQASKKLSPAASYFLEREFEDQFGEEAPALSWRIKRLQDPTNDSAGESQLDFYEVDLFGEPFRFYAQNGLENLTDSPFTVAKDNAFQRVIQIDQVSSTSYDATVTVSWEVDEIPQSISLTRSIGNVR